jgi:hypothetical protein
LMAHTISFEKFVVRIVNFSLGVAFATYSLACQAKYLENFHPRREQAIWGVATALNRK